jgi:hypothetical protein
MSKELYTKHAEYQNSRFNIYDTANLLLRLRFAPKM